MDEEESPKDNENSKDKVIRIEVNKREPTKGIAMTLLEAEKGRDKIEKNECLSSEEYPNRKGGSRQDYVIPG